MIERHSRIPSLIRSRSEPTEFITFAARHGINVVQATPTQIYRRSWVQESLLHCPNLTRRMAERAERLARQLGVSFVNGLRMVYLNRTGRVLGFIRKKEVVDFPTDPSTCLKPWNSVYIEPDGEVRPCCYQSPVYGNIYETDFPALWNGKEAVELRHRMAERRPPQLCRDCYEFNRHNPAIMIQVRSS